MDSPKMTAVRGLTGTSATATGTAIGTPAASAATNAGNTGGNAWVASSNWKPVTSLGRWRGTVAGCE